MGQNAALEGGRVFCQVDLAEQPESCQNFLAQVSCFVLLSLVIEGKPKLGMGQN